MTRVLVIDDDAAIRQLIVFALSDEGYLVDEAPEGRTALELVARSHPDVIILDMKMPVMDGWEFAKRYRARYAVPAPILVLTAAPNAAQRGADINAAGFMAKPFDLSVLVERVSLLARRIRPA